jgi:hypothetical protein
VLVLGQLEHEVIRESLDVAFHRLDQDLGFDVIERGEVGAEHDPVAADDQYRLFDAP